MKHLVYRKKWRLAILIVLLLGAIGVGCASTVKHDEPATSSPPPATATTPAPAPSPPPASSPEKTLGKYYYFDDVLVPAELEYDRKKSFVYETSQFKAGTLYFTGWHFDTNSLFDFFSSHMAGDGWKMVTGYRGKESSLMFYKPDKGCVIRISESWVGKAYVEIRVGPTDVKKN